MALANRMAKELKMLRKSPPEGVCAWQEEAGGGSGSGAAASAAAAHGGGVRLIAQLQGPAGTVYEGGVFRLTVHVPDRYPFEPPKVTFATRVFHPNIDANGRVCLDVLDLPPKGAWRPSLNLVTVLAAVRQLLAEPNADDPLDADATELYTRDRAAFDAAARRMVDAHARGSGGGGGGGGNSAAVGAVSVLGGTGSDNVKEPSAAAAVGQPNVAPNEQQQQQQEEQQQQQQQQLPPSPSQNGDGQQQPPKNKAATATAAADDGRRPVMSSLDNVLDNEPSCMPPPAKVARNV